MCGQSHGVRSLEGQVKGVPGRLSELSFASPSTVWKISEWDSELLCAFKG